MATSETGTGTSSLLGGEYQVFLSFRGPDTRRGFTDTLYNALVDAGIHVFIDNEELRPGERIEGTLLRAIDDSRLYIPIFSPSYASSHWCLRELAKMVENTSKSIEEGNKKAILPIFYNVKPDDVKLRTPLYSNDILNLEQMMKDSKKKFTSQDVDKWREALRRVGGTSGLDLQNYTGDGDLSKTVVNEVVDRLKTRKREVTKDLVGMEVRIAAINNLLDIDSGGVRLIGIYGMGGVGKTTLAQKIFNQLCPRFGKSCSFLADIRETAKTKGLVKLQEQLLSDISNSRVAHNIFSSDDGIKVIEETICNKKVLIILDDVDDGNQIQKLIGRNSLYPDTRVLVTTRDSGVLNIRGFKYRFEHYELEGLSNEHALQLFSRHAFDDDSPLANYYTLSKGIVSTADGLPLALEAIGSSLFGKKNKKIWEVRLEKLRRRPHKDVLGKLRISYDALEPDHQQIFLDVACFFIGENKTNPIYMWKDCGFGPEDAIDVLINRCLIKILDNNIFWMHDQFRDLGRAIAKEEHTRLWDRDDITCGIRSTEIKRSVQALRLQAEFGNPITITAKEIEQFPNLQFLWLSNVICQGDLVGCLSKLKWIYLSYVGHHPQYIATNLHLENMVVMHTYGYEWAEIWYKNRVPIVEARKLKALTLQYSYRLPRTPTFSGCSVLEKLTILRCGRLVEIDCSIGKLRCLTDLCVEYCRELEKLPEHIGELKNLERLTIRKCEQLKELPDSISELESLTMLDVSSTGITRLPDSIVRLQRLSFLDVSRTKIVKLPGTTSKLSQLHILNLYRCNEIQELPELPGSLTTLQLESNSLQTVPDLSNLTNLVELLVSDASDFYERWNIIQPCELSWIRRLSKLRKLELDLLNADATSTEWGSLSLLEELALYGLELRMLRQLPSNLRVLNLNNTQVKQVELDGLPQLEELTIRSCKFVTRVSIPSSLTKLREVCMYFCHQLVEIHLIGVFKSMESLVINTCESFERLVCLSEEPGCNEMTDGWRRVSLVSSSLMMLQKLELRECPELQDWCRWIERIIDASSSEVPKECQIEMVYCGKILDSSSRRAWESYRDKILNGPTQAADSEIETTFADYAIETGDPPLEQQDDGDEDDDDEHDGMGDEDDEDNNVHEVLQSSCGPPLVSSVGDNNVNEEDEGKGDGDVDRMTTRKRRTMNKLKRRVL